MSIKCLKKYLSRNLLKCYLYIDYEAPQERNDQFATMNKIKSLKNPVLVGLVGSPYCDVKVHLVLDYIGFCDSFN